MKAIALLPICLLAGCAAAGVVNLAWDRPADTNGIAGYQVRHAQSGAVLASVSGPESTNATVTVPNGTVQMVAVSIADDGTASDPSNVVTNSFVSKPNNLKRK
jgi:hypothetical protein